MLTHCLVVTVGLIVVSVLSKVIFDGGVTTEHQSRMLVEQAVHWRDVAKNDVDDIVKLEHYVTASTFLSAARSIANDVVVERASGVDVVRLANELEKGVVASRPENPKPKARVAELPRRGRGAAAKS